MIKISSKTMYKSIHIKIFLQLFVSIICHFYHIFAIIYKSILEHYTEFTSSPVK